VIYDELAEIAGEEFFVVTPTPRLWRESFVCTLLMEAIWTSGFPFRKDRGKVCLRITGNEEWLTVTFTGMIKHRPNETLRYMIPSTFTMEAMRK